MEQLAIIYEAIEDLINELKEITPKQKTITEQNKLKEIISNLYFNNDEIYKFYETEKEYLKQLKETETEKKQFKDILSNILDYEEKLYLKIKYQIYID